MRVYVKRGQFVFWLSVLFSFLVFDWQLIARCNNTMPGGLWLVGAGNLEISPDIFLSRHPASFWLARKAPYENAF